MSTNIKDAVATVRSVARSFQAVIDLANAIDSVGDIDQATAEAGQRLRTVQLQGIDAQLQLDATLSQIAEASGHVTGAETAANDIVAKAQVQANEIIAAAQVEASNTTAQTEAEAKIAKKAAVSARDALKSINQDIADARETLNTLNTNIETTKAQLRALAS